MNEIRISSKFKIGDLVVMKKSLARAVDEFPGLVEACVTPTPHKIVDIYYYAATNKIDYKLDDGTFTVEKCLVPFKVEDMKKELTWLCNNLEMQIRNERDRFSDDSHVIAFMNKASIK